MVRLVIAIIAVLVFCLLVGVIASVTPKRHHIKIRFIMVSLGIVSLAISLLGYGLNIFLGIGLIAGGLLFMPIKRQLELILDVISLQ